VINAFDVSTLSESRSTVSLMLSADPSVSSTISEFITISGTPTELAHKLRGKAYVEDEYRLAYDS